MAENKYIYLIVPLVALVTTQILKFILESIKSKSLKWGRLFNGCGGMPSTHTSFVFSLTMLIGFKNGFDSIYFAICLVFSGIIMFDAMGLRMESSNQAVAINKILDEIFSRDTKNGVKHLTEELGHKPLEVVIGMIVGALIAKIFLII